MSRRRSGQAKVLSSGGDDLPEIDHVMLARIGLDVCLRDQILPLCRIGALRPVLVSATTPRAALDRAAEEDATLILTPTGEIQARLLAAYRTDLTERAVARVSAQFSCRSLPSLPVGSAIGATVCLLGAFALAAPQSILTPLLWLAVAAMTANTVLGAIGLAISAVKPRGTDTRDLGIVIWPTMTLLVPLLRETAVLHQLVEVLNGLDYPAEQLDIKLICEEEDGDTRDALARLDLPAHFQVVMVPAGPVKTKPRALNYAMTFARGSLVGIYDADDMPARDQLRQVVRRFATEGPKVACVQGILAYYNASQSWITRAFALDYAMWFRIVLPALARLDAVVPLGGTTVFFRRDALEAVGAWDSHNVTEDADLGVRLRRHGYRCALIDSMTKEEATARPVPWIRQRSRWLKGYALTWAVHMRSPAQLWRDLGPGGFLWFQLLFLGALLGFALAPLLWLAWLAGATDFLTPFAPWAPSWYWLSIPLLASISVQIAVASRAAMLAGLTGLIGWIPALWPYFILGTVAVYRALIQSVLRPFWWDKTVHGAGPRPVVQPRQNTAVNRT